MPLLVVKPTKPLPRKTVSANDELLLLLERGLPESISRTWMTSKEIETLFKKGGLTLPKRFVSKALKSNIDNSRCWAKNIFYDKLHLCFAGENNLAFATPKDQRGFLRDATTDEEKEKICPAISDGYFLDFQLNHLTKFRQPSSGSAATATVLQLLLLQRLQEILPQIPKFHRLQAILGLLTETGAVASARSFSFLHGYSKRHTEFMMEILTAQSTIVLTGGSSKLLALAESWRQQ